MLKVSLKVALLKCMFAFHIQIASNVFVDSERVFKPVP